MGNARPGAPGARSGSVHPHVHGERESYGYLVGSTFGSSPRTWGTREANGDFVRRNRFIPTYMGNAGERDFPRTFGAVHPHVHGERTFDTHPGKERSGSSPRTWGTRLLSVNSCSCFRFIPTYMGNATLLESGRRPSPVHPHVHGEREIGSVVYQHVSGSSPRTWGTLLQLVDPVSPGRFIPTYMGNARIFVPYVPRRAVHPHVHGERGVTDAPSLPGVGSSPRTWGTPEPRDVLTPPKRFIPTYMGNAQNSEPH